MEKALGGVNITFYPIFIVSREEISEENKVFKKMAFTSLHKVSAILSNAIIRTPYQGSGPIFAFQMVLGLRACGYILLFISHTSLCTDNLYVKKVSH